MDKKNELRHLFLDYRKNMAGEQINTASLMIKNRFLKLQEVDLAQKILIYVSYKNEVHTHGLIKRMLVEGKQVFVPYCLVEDNQLGIAPIQNMEKDLIEGAYGILEPSPELRNINWQEKLDIIVVPGVAFSRTGYRIGYGGGYYDRYLKQVSRDTLKIGFTFDALLVDSLPVEKYDLPVDLIITEKEIVSCR